MVVAGSAIFNSDNYKETIDKMRAELAGGFFAPPSGAGAHLSSASYRTTA